MAEHAEPALPEGLILDEDTPESARVARLLNRPGNVFVLVAVNEHLHGQPTPNMQAWYWDVFVRPDETEQFEQFEQFVQTVWAGDPWDLQRGLASCCLQNIRFTAATDELYEQLEGQLRAVRETGICDDDGRVIFESTEQARRVCVAHRPGSLGPATLLGAHELRHRDIRPRPPDAGSWITSDRMSQAATLAMWSHPSDWITGPQVLPHFIDQRTGVQVYVLPAGANTSAPSAAAIAAATQTVLKLDDATVSTFLICLGRCLAATPDALGPSGFTRVHVDDILAFRGLAKHVKGGYKTEQKRETRDHILRLNDIWVRSEEDIYESNARGQRLKKHVGVDSRLFEVQLESEQLQLFSSEEIPYAFRIHLGAWATPYIGADNKQIAFMLDPIMRYSLNDGASVMAQRLGVYLAMQWAIRGREANWDQTWRVATMLTGAGVNMSGERNPQRRREYFERALDRLQADGVLKRWEYGKWNDELPQRGWVPKWLGWTVSITPPETIVNLWPAIPAARRRRRRAAHAAQKKKG